MKATVDKVSSRIEVKERKQEGILGYDIDNNYPGRCRDIVAASSMGTSCVDLYRKFIFGKGFQDIEFSKKVINSKGLTPDKLLRKIVDDFSHFKSCYLHFNYNALYEVSSISYQPFDHVRKTTDDNKDYPDMYAVYSDWGEKRIKKEEIKYIHKYNPDPAEIQKQVDACGGWDNYRGQLFFYSVTGKDYPLAVYDASLEDMQTDSKSKTYKYRNVSTNFMASHILKISRIEGENASRELQDLKSSVAEFQGADEAMKVMTVEVDSEDQVFDFEKVDQQSGDREFEWTETSVRNNIRQSFLQPPALLMELQGKISVSSDERSDAINSYNATTEDERLAIEELFRKSFENYHDKSVNPTGNYAITPIEPPAKEDTQKKKDVQALVKDTGYTVEQKVKMLIDMYGYSEDDAKKLVSPSDAGISVRTLSEKLGVGGTQSMMAVLSDAVMTPLQKRGSLKVLFGLTEEQINELIPLTDVANTGPAAKL